MSDFYTRKPVPMGRIVFYGFLAAAAVVALGYFQHDPKLYIFAIIAGLFIGGFGFYASWIRANVRPNPGETYPPLSRFPAVVRWLIVIGVFAGIVATVLDILHKK
jgi:ABC-type multidrug transport system fused ATPase/permease subunit